MLFICFLNAFKIQERSTLKFVHAFGDGVIAMVDTPEEATALTLLKSKRDSVDGYIVNNKNNQVFSLGTDKHYLLFEESAFATRQEFQINLDKDGFYQISHGKDLFLQYDSFVNGLKIGKFEENKNIGFLLFQDNVALPYPPDVNTGVESPYRKKVPGTDIKKGIDQYLIGSFGNEAAEEYQNLKYFTSEKLDRHHRFVKRPLEPADYHPEKHNAGVNVYRKGLFKSFEDDRIKVFSTTK